MNQADRLSAVSFMLLMGDDALSREKARNDVITALTASGGQISVERYDPDGASFVDFCERMMTSSLFQSIRLFHLSDAHLLSGEELDQLTGVFGLDIPDVYVLVETDRTRSKRGLQRPLPKDFLQWLDAFLQKAKQRPEKFSMVEFAMPPDYKLAQWLESRTHFLLGRSISHSDAEYLVDLIGNDSSMLYSELQKLDVFLPPQKPIDREAIDAVTGATRLMAPFELAQALGKKDFAKVLEVIESIYRSSVFLPMFISAIFKHFWALFRITVYEKANPDKIRQFAAALRRYNKPVQNEIGLEIGLAAGLLTENQAGGVYPKIIVPGVVQQSQSFTEAQYKSIFKWLGDYDIGIKTGRIDDSKIGLQLLCYKIFRAAEVSE